ncbi:MAG: metallophosphoesterase [Clostridia bacterium]
MAKITKLQARKVENSNLKANFDGEYEVFKKIKGQDFKILQLTDMHFGRGFLSIKKDKLAHNAVVSLVERTKPDLIIITGNNVYPLPMFSGTINNLHQSKYVGNLMETFGIPWTFAFGNHDAEPMFCTHNKSQLAEYYESLDNCLFKKGDKNIFGVGNHIIKLQNEDGKENTILAMLDSNMYLKKSFFSSFDNIHDDQIDWLQENIKHISGNSKLVNSLAFFHMPLREYLEAWNKLKMGKTDEVTYHLGTIGEKNDHVGYSYYKDGTFFDRMLEFGSLVGCFCGHDHLNNISMTYKGIRLTYGMAIDFLAYPGINKVYSNRGGTLITIDDNSNFDVNLVPLVSAVEQRSDNRFEL